MISKLRYEKKKERPGIHWLNKGLMIIKDQLPHSTGEEGKKTDL